MDGLIRFLRIALSLIPGPCFFFSSILVRAQGQVYAWGHNRVAQLGIGNIGNSFTVPKNLEGAYFLPTPQLVESLAGMVGTSGRM